MKSTMKNIRTAALTPMLTPITTPLFGAPWLPPYSGSEFESTTVALGLLVVTMDVMTTTPPVESDEVARVVIVVGASVVIDDRLEDVVTLSLVVVALDGVLVKGGTEDGAFGVLVIEVTVVPSGTSMTSLSSQLQQSGFCGSRFLSQHQLPSEHWMMASLPAAVLSGSICQLRFAIFLDAVLNSLEVQY